LKVFISITGRQAVIRQKSAYSAIYSQFLVFFLS
jgi:hypothetical protein